MSITLTYGSDSITIKQPYFGYRSTLRMPFHYSRTTTGYKVRDDGTANDIRMCDISTWLLDATDQAALYEFLNNTAKGRCNNFTMALGETPSGFFPFGPDKGDTGFFECSVLRYDPKNAQLNPYLQHDNGIVIVLKTALSAYTPAAKEAEGTLQIGTLTTLRPVQSFPMLNIDRPIVSEMTRSGLVYSVDIGNSGDVYESTLSLEMRAGNAAALITYLQATRAGDITITTPTNTWLFGIAKGSSGTYTVKLISGEITMIHDRFDLFKTDLKLWFKA